VGCPISRPFPRQPQRPPREETWSQGRKLCCAITIQLAFAQKVPSRRPRLAQELLTENMPKRDLPVRQVPDRPLSKRSFGAKFVFQKGGPFSFRRSLLFSACFHTTAPLLPIRLSDGYRSLTSPRTAAPGLFPESLRTSIRIAMRLPSDRP
jgi:hypothetical protein